MCDQAPSNIPLPSGWPDSVRFAVICVISLAHYAIVTVRGWAANSINARLRLAAKNDRLNQEPFLVTVNEDKRSCDTQLLARENLGKGVDEV